jgi:multidrug efflux pump
MNEVRDELAGLPGVQAFPVMRQGFGQRISKPVEFVLGGGTYEELAEWRDLLMDHVREDNPRLIGLDSNYRETQPQLRVKIDYDRAADLGVTVTEIGRTLEVLLGGRNVTRYLDNGQEYNVIVEGDRASQSSPRALDNIQVRSARSGELIPLASLVSFSDEAGASTLNRFNRLRAITIEANLADGYSLGEALDYLEPLRRRCCRPRPRPTSAAPHGTFAWPAVPPPTC